MTSWITRRARGRCLSINNAYNLMGRNVGLMKYTGGLTRSPDFDVEPYVSAQIGKVRHRTPSVSMVSDPNNLNPAWNTGNRFTFYLEPLDSLLELQVFAITMPAAAASSLGKVRVDIDGLKSGQWQ